MNNKAHLTLWGVASRQFRRCLVRCKHSAGTTRKIMSTDVGKAAADMSKQRDVRVDLGELALAYGCVWGSIFPDCGVQFPKTSQLRRLS
jgi:hypothetical protein